MDLKNNLESKFSEVPLQAIGADIWTLAKSYEGDTHSLLALLRTLEQAHRKIRESLFQQSLPDNRQQLYALLKNIEESGGWPYVERMKLRSLLANLPESQPPNSDIERASESSP